MANFTLETNNPIAEDSPDHIQPRATWKDNTMNQNFNDLVMELFDYKPHVLDFGCAGGGMVRTLIDDGCVAVGLEGSDYNLKNGLHEWTVIPDNLFTCDLGYPFTLKYGKRDYAHKFDVITMWEFIEHIPEERLPTVMNNAKRHLKENGFIVGSTNQLGSVFEGVEHHLTQKPIAWWYDFFAKQGLRRWHSLYPMFEGRKAWVRSVRDNFVIGR